MFLVNNEGISKDWLLFNHEDNFLLNAYSQLYEDQHDSWVDRSHRRIDLLLPGIPSISSLHGAG